MDFSIHFDRRKGWEYNPLTVTEGEKGMIVGRIGPEEALGRLESKQTEGKFRIGVDLRGFNDLMRETRKRMGLSQRALAHEVNEMLRTSEPPSDVRVSPRDIRDIELLKVFPGRNLASVLALALNVEEDELFPGWLEVWLRSKKGSAVRPERRTILVGQPTYLEHLEENGHAVDPVLTNERAEDLLDAVESEEVYRKLEEGAEDWQRTAIIKVLVRELKPSILRNVVTLRYGLFGWKEHTLEEAAEILQISPDAAGKIEKIAITKLRQLLHS